MRVLKFGGSSVGSPEAIRALVDIVRGGGDLVVVVSAFSGVTDGLIAAATSAAGATSPGAARSEGLAAIEARHRDAMAALLTGARAKEAREAVEALGAELGEILSGVRILRELSPRSLDLVMSFGERLSVVVVAAALREAELPARAVDARGLILATPEYGNARPIRGPTEQAIREALRPGGGPSPWLPVVTGFIASTEGGETVTLGRGGSDLSASIIGAALGAEEVEIWTDVNGIMTADPRKVRDAFSLECLSYEEAAELSHFGEKVLYPPTIQPALEACIPIRIRNSFDLSFPGTVIRSGAPPSRYPVRGISSIPEASLVRLQGPGMVGVTGIAMRLFGCLARRRINIILISQASSERSICFAVSPRDSSPAIAAIAEEFADEIADGRIGAPLAEGGKAILAVVGERMKRTPGISGRVFHALGRNGVNVSAIAQGSSELNISAVVDAKDEAKALAAVHEAFFLAGTRSVNVFLVGCGLIGGTLLAQIRGHRTILADEYSVRVNVAGIANSRRMLLAEGGVDLDRWRDLLGGSGEAMDPGAFIARAREMSLPNSVFVDCTASDEVPRLYPEAFKASMAVVTPNKKGNAGSMRAYKELAAAARASGARYLYETTAGAGLPVISTLHDLMVSGDRITRIDAMLSGTIGFVLAGYSGKESFASLLRAARSLGYTEPDPRDDLSAADCARKALILAREAGREIEPGEMEVESLIPPSCEGLGSVDDFLDRLEIEEPAFRARLESAASRGRSLVYAATIDDRGIRLGLREAGPGDPLYGLRDAENVVAFTTERYATLPLTVRGPGAGGAVTAGGLFADIVRVAKSLV